MTLQLAIKSALDNPIKARGHQSISRFSAVLTDGYRTFIGLNSYKTCPFQARFAADEHKIHIHAEIAAIKKAFSAVYSSSNLYGDFKPLRNYKMYVARLLADGTPALAKPCMGCMGAIETFGIKHLEYTE